MKVAIITSGFLPVPASRGGAVEAIVDNFIKINEEKKNVEFDVFSIYDEKAEEISKVYNETKFYFKRTNQLIRLIDKIIFLIAKYILKKEKVMSYRYIAQRLDFLNKVSKDLAKNNYDKILIENNPTLFLALKWRKNDKKYAGRYYYHVHNEIKSSYGCEEIIKKCKKIICVSNYIKKHIMDRFNAKDENVEVLINCIDTDRFTGYLNEKEKNELKNKYGINQDEKILVFAGRLSKEKGIKELIEAIKKVQYENFKLLIVGEFFYNTKIKNKFEIELKNLINQVKDTVIFTGFIPYNQISKIYALADVAVLPSIWDDPAPLTIIESMASGLPIITTNSGGIPEYAKNGCAIVLEKNNELLVENLKTSIEKALKDEELRKNMSKISKENARDLNLINFYNNLMKEIEVN